MPRVRKEMTQQEFVECCQDACANLAKHFADMPDEVFEEALDTFIDEVLMALALTFGTSTTPEMIAGVRSEIQTDVRNRRCRTELHVSREA